MRKSLPPPKIIYIWRGSHWISIKFFAAPIWSPKVLQMGANHVIYDKHHKIPRNMPKTLVFCLLFHFCQFYVCRSPLVSMGRGCNVQHTWELMTLSDVKNYFQHFSIEFSSQKNRRKPFKTQKNMFFTLEIWRVFTVCAKKSITNEALYLEKIS